MGNKEADELASIAVALALMEIKTLCKLAAIVWKAVGNKEADELTRMAAALALMEPETLCEVAALEM